MICSMTGYAVKARDIERGTLQLELKSVNSRYLDFHFRIVDDLRALEMPLRELLSAKLSRGKVECRLSFHAAAARAEQLQVNVDLLDLLRGLVQQLLVAIAYHPHYECDEPNIPQSSTAVNHNKFRP